MSDGDRWCRIDQKSHPKWTGRFCPDHPGVELGPEPTDVRIIKPAEDALRTVCWRCGTQSAHAANDTCARCHESLVPPALVIDFPAGSVVLRDRLTSVVLGRAGRHGPVFASHPNVSRRHATVGVDEAGDAWITPIPEAPNGTFVNDQEIFARTVIGSRDHVRFATDREPLPGPVSERIRQPVRER